MKIINPSVTLLDSTKHPERVIERAGRVCYQSTHKTKECEKCFGNGEFNTRDIDGDGYSYPCKQCDGTGTDNESAIAFVRMIIKRGHESVIEHAMASFSIVCDRGVTHETVRHRVGCSFSQESTRFCNYMKEVFGKEISVIEPPWVGTNEDQALAQVFWREAVEFVEARYFRLLEEAHQPPELARSVLQTCLKTEIVVTANFRAWRHFLILRTSPKAHPQMRQIAEMIRTELMALSPVCFEDIP